MGDRTTLHTKMQEVYPEYRLYFRPPTKLILEYPCIVYEPRTFDVTHSNNTPYNIGTIFNVTMMRPLPGDPEEAEGMLSIQGSEHTTSFVRNDIVHDVFTIHVH